MTRTSPATDHWSVTTRTQGGVQSAVASQPPIEMALLGIPEGFTAAEIQSWLRDLAGVAIETSRTDERSRPIPPLLHHALTGLLFSQTELWSHTGQALPCAAVFVETPQGTAFGWVGRARVVLLVNGEPYEPQWVIVRDESGQEAMSAMLPPQSHVLLTLEYWPQGETGQQAPASADAEWGQSFMSRSAVATEGARPSASSASLLRPGPSPMPVTPAAGATHSPAAVPLSAPWPATPPLSTAEAAPPSPSVGTSTPSSVTPALPIQQPGLAPDPSRSLSLDEQDSTQSLPSTFHASSSTFSMPSLPGATPSSAEALHGVPRPETDLTRGGGVLAPGGEHEPGHPVGRWLTRLMSFAMRAPASAFEPEPSLRERAPIAPSTPHTLEPVAPAAIVPPPPAITMAPPVLPASASSTPPSPASVLAVPVISAPAAPVPSPVTPAPKLSAPTDARAPQPPPVSAEASTVRVPQIAPPLVPPSAIAPPLNKPTSAPPSAPVSQAPAAPPLAPLASPGSPTLHTRGTPAVTPPVASPLPPPAKSGLLAVGLSDILGSLAAGATPKPVAAPAESPTARQVPSPPPPAVTPAPPAPPRAPYPVAGTTPPRSAPVTRGPIEIEREPVGAAAEFAIPKLPPRDAPKPFRVPVPTAADSMKPSAPASPIEPTHGANLAPPTPASFPTPAAHATSAPPAQYGPPRVGAPGSVGPASAAPVRPRPPAVPEPPADFLAEFAASLGAEIEEVPPPSPPSDLRRSVPSLPSVMRAVANVPPSAPPVPSPTAGIAPLPAPAPVTPPPAVVGYPVLSTPSQDAPIPVAPSELSEILRELPLPPNAPPSETEVPDGMLVATPISPARLRRGQWPAAEDFEPEQAPVWKNPWLIGAFIALLFGVGWIVGHAQTADNDLHATPMSRMLRAVGLAGARFTAIVDSDPPGAIISVDGKESGRRTPATIELPPGPHKITLSMPDLGQVEVDVRGSRGQSLKVSEGLHGSLKVTALDKTLPVKVSLDGQPLGFLPQTVDKLPPGLHEVQFSGPNMQPWAQNISVPIRGTATVTARPMMSPATGVLQVHAILNDEGGSSPLSGASVFVDGELKGSTPQTFELPRGPHSLKVTYRGVVAPVQVIDLPGGNKRFAQFQFGLDSDLPPLKLKRDYGALPAKQAVLVEASLDGLDWKDVREAWLHVRTGEGLWRRYQVTIEEGPRGALLSAPFPPGVGEQGSRVLWYMSAATNQGDDFYTEMQRSMR